MRALVAAARRARARRAEPVAAAAAGAGGRGRVQRGVRRRRCRRRSSARASAGWSPGALTPGDLLRLPQALTIRERQPDQTTRPTSAAAARARSGGRARRSPISTRCGRAKATICARISTRGATLLGDLVERDRRGGRRRPDGDGARLAERVRELRAELQADETAVAQEIVAMRGAVGHQRGGRAVPRPPRALVRARRRARAVRPQARLPAAGDEPRGQHDGLEGRRPAASRSSSSRRRPSSRRCASRSRMSSRRRAGLLFIVSAPSGTGKTTLVERLVEMVPDLRLSRSYTSRAGRDGRDGRRGL